jgi:hypothetical protein
MDEAKATIQNAFIIVFISTAVGIIYNFPLIKYFLSHGNEFNVDENISKISLFEAKYLFDTGELLETCMTENIKNTDSSKKKSTKK